MILNLYFKKKLLTWTNYCRETQDAHRVSYFGGAKSGLLTQGEVQMREGRGSKLLISNLVLILTNQSANKILSTRSVSVEWEEWEEVWIRNPLSSQRETINSRDW